MQHESIHAPKFPKLIDPNFTSSMFIFTPATDQSSCYGGDMKSDGVTPIIGEDEETQKAVQADLPPAVSSERSTESTDPQLNTQPEESTTTSDPPTSSTEHQPPSSPMMDLETDFPPGETSYNLN